MEHIPGIDLDILRAAIMLRRFIGEAIMEVVLGAWDVSRNESSQRVAFRVPREFPRYCGKNA